MAVVKPALRRPMSSIPRRARARVLIKTEKCKGCRFCIEFCPSKSLQLSTKFNAKGYHYPVVVKDDCINCSLCTLICPDYAIFSLPSVSLDRVTRADSSPARTAVASVTAADTPAQRVTPPPLGPALRQQRASCGGCTTPLITDAKEGAVTTLLPLTAGAYEEKSGSNLTGMASGERSVRQREVIND